LNLNPLSKPITAAPQSARDAACLLFLAVSLAWYCHNLRNYLAEIGSPWIIVSGFWMSLTLAVLHEWKFPLVRMSFAKIVATSVMFAIGVLLAQYLRMQYVDFVHATFATPELSAFFGEDVAAAMRNRVVGFGGCYALALMLMRWVAYKPMLRMCVECFVPAESRQSTCPHCGQSYRPGADQSHEQRKSRCE